MCTVKEFPQNLKTNSQKRLSLWFTYFWNSGCPVEMEEVFGPMILNADPNDDDFAAQPRNSDPQGPGIHVVDGERVVLGRQLHLTQAVRQRPFFLGIQVPKLKGLPKTNPTAKAEKRTAGSKTLQCS